MLAALAAVLFAVEPATAPLHAVPQLTLAAKKKKARGGAPKEKEAPAETSEGLDLTEPAAAAPSESSDSTSSAEPSVAEEAAPTKPQSTGFSLVTPHTVGESQNALEAGVGWPGVYASYWRGLANNLDVGAKVGFNWGYEGLLARPVPGLRLQLQARFQVFDNGSLSLGVSFAPGVLLYFFPGTGLQPGVLLPLAATLGLPNFVNKLSLSARLEVPFFVIFRTGPTVPVLVGASAEYALSDALLVFVRLMPLGFAVNSAGSLFYTFEGYAGVGYHL
ncbi:MAG: hypothetical protein IPJ65_41530 [Archangiaceae bacterium]|nr:hypothetical protein [Archangiaceae bacterium]